MDAKSAATVLPRYWRGVRKNHVGVQAGFSLCSFDTETFFGRVFALGFSDPDGNVSISHGLGANHVAFLIDKLFSVPGVGARSVVCGAHYMVFDLGVLFYSIINPMGSKMAAAPRRIHFSYLMPSYLAAKKSRRSALGLDNPEIEIFFGKPCFAKFRRNKRTIHLIDTFSFFTMSLAKALEMVGAEVQKLKKPTDLGKRVIPLKELRPYLNNDCRGVLELLKYIQGLHQKYETRLCVSLPQLSARIFRHWYLKKDFPIPSKPLIRGALLSYHGGKNSFIGSAGWYHNCWDLDINSAYAEAMSQLPDFEHGRWRLGSGRKFLRDHPHGIYKVSGALKHCRYGAILSHDFRRIGGEIKDVWTTGYEINEAIKSGEFNPRSITGYGFAQGVLPRKYHGTAFKRFVMEFYRLKTEAKTKTEKYFYKLIPNSTYGKLIARIEDEDGNMVAGSMFDPAIASLITGFVRAKIHAFEHRYKAIHTATDGFITQIKPRKSDLGEGIGQLKADTFGSVLILRNKLYLFFDKKTGVLKKSGLHGFEGKAEELEALWNKSRRIYNVRRLVKWGEAFHIGLPPGSEMTIRKQLTIK